MTDDEGARRSSAPLRIGLFADGDFSDPRTNSGVAAGILGGLRAQPDVDVVFAESTAPTRLQKILLRALTIRLPVARWKSASRQNSLARRWRSRARDAVLTRNPDSVDTIVHVRNVYEPAAVPYAAFIDSTFEMAGAWRPWRVSARAREAEERYLRGADEVFTAGRAARESVIADYGVDPTRTFAVGGGANLLPSEEPHRDASADAPLRVLFVGLDLERKGGDVVIEAVRRCRAAGVAVEVTMVGHDGPAGEGITWAGPIWDRAELARLYAVHDVLAHPARHEPYGLVVLEGMGFGLPAVVSDVGSLPDIVDDGSTGLVCHVDAVEEFSEAITLLAENTQMRREMGERASQRARTEHTWDAVARRLTASLREARERAAPSRERTAGRAAATRRATGDRLAMTGYYFANTAVLGLAALLLIPALVLAASPDHWAQIAIGQAVGAVFGILVGMGWTTVGAGLIANVSPTDAAEEYLFSLYARVVLFALVSPVVVFATLLATMNGGVDAVLAALQIALTGIGPGWYFIGRGQPRQWLLMDTVPRAAGSLVAMAIAFTTGSVTAAIGATIVALLVGTALSTLLIARTGESRAVRWRAGFGPRPFAARLRRQSPLIASGLVFSALMVLPLALVNVLLPSLVASFALLDKIQRQAATAISPIVQIAQYALARGDLSDFPARLRAVGFRYFGVTALISVAFVVAGPLLVRLLGAGQIEVPFSAILATAAVIAFTQFEQFATRAMLGNLGILAPIPWMSALGALIGLGLLVPAGSAFGVTGVLSAIALGLLAASIGDVVAYRVATRDRFAVRN
ncbi:glycosyltransferase [Microbacterium hominis]|uniref:D-inositol 3-phosphate glycosyltransferase n=1 Tax=Microbacterium hominis TaxID=162426 RepID=A0A7D4Q3S1_9MICO|nr:glycosyltransferase [Microbacterium hominis]QKJ20271.1 glycosyltransferase [Microbacterium hominis]